MKRRRKRTVEKSSVPGRIDRSSSQRGHFARVMRELEAVAKTRPDADPLVEQLRKCPETFIVGEMLGKIFDALKYSRTSAEDDERLTPPPGVVLPLV